MSIVNFEEAGHKLLKIKMKPGQEELSEHLGIHLLNKRLNDSTMQHLLESIFPKDDPKNTSFSIKNSTAIGPGCITENMRKYLRNKPCHIIQQQQIMAFGSDDESRNSSISSDSDASSYDSGSSSSLESECEKMQSKRRRGNGLKLSSRSLFCQYVLLYFERIY